MEGGGGSVGESSDRSASPNNAAAGRGVNAGGGLTAVPNGAGPLTVPADGAGGANGGGATAQKTWVKFEEEQEEPGASSKSPSPSLPPPPASGKQSGSSNQRVASSPSTMDSAPPAVLPTETVHVNLDTRSPKQVTPPNASQSGAGMSSVGKGTAAATAAATGQPNVTTQPGLNKTSQPAVIDIPKQSVNVVQPIQSQNMRTIELSTGRVREGFANGDVIVTLLPTNTRWPWITPAVFRPELVPEELMAQGLTLTVEEYVHAMETLVNDYRFTLYNICYKRVLIVWILFAFVVLVGLLFSGIYGITLFSLGVAWLFLNAAAIFLCMWVKLKLARGLERCMARVNKQLIRHKILLALDDRGHISCHKVNLCFLYFEPSQCISYLNEFIERSEQNGNTIEPGWESRLDVTTNDIVIQGANTTRLSRKQERGMLLLLRYASRWGNEARRGLIDVTQQEPARHCPQYQCPCQYVEQHLKCKPRGLRTLSPVNSYPHY
ncbi:uncharacterized protein LOC118468788 isoform X4 [Anopheles albimanus]|uniref:uncharacterized protein LOC118468788 isoform X4 n=1 Tax=Anopheles albimanus TaxID=7167 RepID=UPI00163E3CFB|nr:uncharacterized protein LOC118468788 isoform X4 [Anopheles albimanus]XP_035795885.1 uncharacterized protein LOC118468788 isoform X4 [Anopheles albimanus]